MNNKPKQDKQEKDQKGENCPTQEPQIGGRTAGTAEGDEKTVDKALHNDKDKK